MPCIPPLFDFVVHSTPVWYGMSCIPPLIDLSFIPPFFVSTPCIPPLFGTSYIPPLIDVIRLAFHPCLVCLPFHPSCSCLIDVSAISPAWYVFHSTLVWLIHLIFHPCLVCRTSTFVLVWFICLPLSLLGMSSIPPWFDWYVLHSTLVWHVVRSTFVRYQPVCLTFHSWLIGMSCILPLFYWCSFDFPSTIIFFLQK